MFTKPGKVDRPISARRIVRVVGDSPVTVILEGVDGELYLVRFSENDQDPRDSAYGWITGVLANSAGLPVTKHQQILVRPEVLQEEPRLVVQMNGQSQLTEPRILLGNRLMAALPGSLRPFSYLPQVDVKNVTNAGDFLGMYIFDLWTERHVPRQVFFQRTGRNRDIRAVFLNDSKIGHPNDYPRDPPSFLCNHNPSLYSGLWTSRAVNGWLETLIRQTPKGIQQAAATLPGCWWSDDLGDIYQSLALRLQTLPTLVEAKPFLPPVVDNKGTEGSSTKPNHQHTFARIVSSS